MVMNNSDCLGVVVRGQAIPMTIGGFLGVSLRGSSPEGTHNTTRL